MWRAGSGKTTLLSLLLREEEATDGEIRVAGNDLRRLSARQVPHYRRQIGFIFQDYKLLNNKTVWENVAFALEVIGTSRSTIKSLVAQSTADGGAHRQGKTTTPMSCPAAKRNASPSQGRM